MIFLSFSTSPFFKTNSNPPIIKLADTNKRIRVLIGNDVWIGDNAYIMSGVSIGNGAVIAAGAVVTKNVEPYSIVAGIPAKHLKFRFTKKTILALEHCAWWELDPNFLATLDVGNVSQLC
jgi:acetyltransferase-like isoleucine patch superfamily enzyme